MTIPSFNVSIQSGIVKCNRGHLNEDEETIQHRGNFTCEKAKLRPTTCAREYPRDDEAEEHIRTSTLSRAPRAGSPSRHIFDRMGRLAEERPPERPYLHYYLQGDGADDETFF